MKLSSKISISIILAATLSVLAIILYITINAKRVYTQIAYENLENSTIKTNFEFKKELQVPMVIAKSMAQIFSSVQNFPANQRRDILNKNLKYLLKNNPDLIGVWTCWEPNALDGLDKNYIDKTLHDSTGRFIPYWFWEKGKIKNEPLRDYSKNKAGDYYLLPKKFKKETVIEPYKYKVGKEIVYMTSLSIPIFIDDKFMGVAGVDVSLKHLLNDILKIKPYKTGYAYLVSNEGVIVAHPNKKWVGKKIQKMLPKGKQKFDKVFKTKGLQSFNNQENGEAVKHVLSALQIGESPNKWILAVAVSENTILAGINSLNIVTYIASFFAILIIGLIAWFIGKKLNKNIQKLLFEVQKLIDSGIEGKLKYRADTNSVLTDFQPILIGFNEVLDTVIQPIDLVNNYLDDISKGVIPKPIETEYKGDYNLMKENLNQMITVLEKLLFEMNQMYKIQVAGNYDYYMDDTIFKGAFQQVAQGYNQAVKLHVDSILGMLKIVGQYGDGDFTQEMPVLPGKQIIATKTINGVRDNLMRIVSTINNLSEKVVGGKLNVKADSSLHKGEYANIVDSINKIVNAIVNPLQNLILGVSSITKNVKNGDLTNRLNTTNYVFSEFGIVNKAINDTLDALVTPLIKASDIMSEVSSGIIPPKITEEYKGDFNKIKTSINTLIDVITAIVSAVNFFIEKTKEGKIQEVNIDTEQFKGSFKQITQGINYLAGFISTPLKEITSTMITLSKGESAKLIQMDGYKGDWLSLRDSINSLIDVNEIISEKASAIAAGNLDIAIYKRSNNDELLEALQNMVQKLSEVVAQINEAADNVASGSLEISNNASSMAQSANEQAVSVEEVTSSIEEMEATINQNAMSAKTTEQDALRAAANIETGSKSVQSTVEAMRTIIEKIQVVSDIADKTDILAINAAIEAARAGEHGEGFAVVAGEVRKLAEMSKTSAKEINQLSKTSLRVAEQSGEMLLKLVPQIKNIAQLIQEIAIASNEQAIGIQQVTKVVTQLNNISQQNAASAEELSTGSEELSSQADMLREIISSFKLSKDYIMTRQNQKKSIFKHKRGINLNLQRKNDSEFEKFD